MKNLTLRRTCETQKHFEAARNLLSEVKAMLPKAEMQAAMIEHNSKVLDAEPLVELLCSLKRELGGSHPEEGLQMRR